MCGRSVAPHPGLSVQVPKQLHPDPEGHERQIQKTTMGVIISYIFVLYD